jgi:hypothetical protein
MRTRRLLTAFAVATLLIALSACRTAPIHNVQNSPVTPTGDEITMEQVKDAIIRAGSGLGWRMRPVESGHIVGELHLRSHMAKVDITYDTDSYDITYKDSSNLDKKGDKIHSNYNGWVQNLDNAIQNNIAML